jgi:branched-chain amino acid transport system substrate-binding protein
MTRSFVHLLAATAAALAASCAWAQAPIKIGIVTFLSGPAAGPFGVPARNAAEIMAEAVNAGRVPGAYATKGFGAGHGL